MDYFQLLCGISVLLLAIYYHYSSCYNFWKSRNIPGPKPIIFIGNFLTVLLKRESIADWTKRLYDQYKNEPAFGIYMGTSPLLIPNNLDIIKDILIRDFSLFAERGFKIFDEKIEPIHQNLVMLEAERWRPLRAKLSPVFTSGKLKEMFPLIVECAGKLEKHLEKLAEEDEPVECRELTAKFGIDSIGSCAFGLDMNALDNENSEFLRMSKQIFAINTKQIIRDFCREFTPSLYKVIGSYLQPKEVNDFFLNLFIDTTKYRMNNNIIRPDFVHLLMELKKHPDRVNNIELTDALLASQTFTFFIGGFETSSSTMSHALYELAQNPEIQDKLREEIRDVYDKNNGVLTYADISRMKYLDKVLKETLRKYPPLPILNRQVMENYTFKGTKISIPKGTNICISIYAIQNDPNVYPDPEKFDPERFNEDAVAARHPMSYLSFGDGPRNCIGARFAQYQSKVGLATILRNHRVDVCEKTKIPFENDNRTVILALKGGVYLKIAKIREIMSDFEILCGLAALLLAFYYYSTSTFDFWKSRGVPGPKPIFLFGNTMELMFARISMVTYLQDLYKAYKNEPMVGLFMRRSPVLVLKDPELIKDVIIRDFSTFTDRGFAVHERTEPLSMNLFNLELKRWRPLRSKLTPMFTSGKLKDMFGLILECAEHFEKYLDKLTEKEEPIDFREVTAKFTTDVIGSCAFGIEMSSLSDEDSKFRKIGRQIFATNLENAIRLKIKLYMPKLYDLLGYIVPDRKLAPFFTKLVTDTMKYRKGHNIYRPDFIHMLMELKEHPEKLGDIKLTDSLLTAQAFVFFAAGFETSSSAMSNALYELALNQEIQDKLRQEIREHLAKHNGELQYEHVKNMEYLEKVFKETLRKYPPGSLLPRKSTSAYTFKDTKVSIPKDSIIWIPMYALHHDADIYPNPEVFNPENFNEDAIEARHPMTYLPFGDGPRNCIGSRFAIFQTKVGLITILRNYKVDVCEKTMIPYEFIKTSFLLTPKGGIYLKLTKLKT
ncbi:uncharacterized protein LOC132911409 [Bombus pascuorum]|uniref:uncharacterized protein LOC132911409 n=1 Tax=Bombus pascuorum TaxID=65598 RepID=UPI00298DA8EA|nr:uncharacterized protein LOC132911409 [Bombus pascuorum]